MLTTNQHDAATPLPPELARPLETVCSDLARKLATGGVRSDELNARFGAMQTILTGAIREVSRDWNSSNDSLRVLPVELRAMCWSYLPQSDLVGLARVCSSWRDLSRSIPSLWTCINLSGPLEILDALISRSGTLPVDVSVLACSIEEHAHVQECLRRHAHRLRSLCVSDRDFRFAGASRGQELFRYPAPMLEHFSLKLVNQVNDGNFTLAPDIFAGCAPRLRSVTLHEMPFPAACPAFRCLTTLEVSWRLDLLSSGLQHIFTVSPDLERLVLSNPFNSAEWLPPIPASNKLRKVVLSAECASFAMLRDHGYLALAQLQVDTYDPRTVQDAGMHQSAALWMSLSVGTTQSTATEVVLRDGETGNTARLTANDGRRRTPYAVLCDAPNFPALRRLALPTATRHPASTTALHYPYLAADLHLPELRTLALAHGAHWQGEFSLFQLPAPGGVLVAPSLSRVEIVRAGAAGKTWQDGVAAIAPGALERFIQEHIRCDKPALLELVVAPENANLLNLGDDEGMESLRRRVGKIVLD